MKKDKDVPEFEEKKNAHKGIVKYVILQILILGLSAFLIGFGIVEYTEQRNSMPEVCKMSEIDLSQDEYITADMVYFDELYVLNRYAVITVYQNNNSDEIEDPEYSLVTPTDYPTSASEDFKGVERYTVMFYDKTGTPFVTTLENDNDDISVLLGKSGGKPVEIALYATVYEGKLKIEDFDISQKAEELSEKNLLEFAKENNAQIADYKLSEEKYPDVELVYHCETQEELMEEIEFDATFSLGFSIFLGVAIIFVDVLVHVKALKSTRKHRKVNND